MARSYYATYNPTKDIFTGLGSLGTAGAVASGLLGTKAAGFMASNPIGWITAAVLAANAAANALTGGISTSTTNKRNDSLYNSLINQGYSALDAEAIVSQYGDTAANNFWDFGNYGDQTNYEAIAELTKMLDEAYTKFGDAPAMLSMNDINDIENRAGLEIDSSNNQILDTYDQVMDNINSISQQNLIDNQVSFNDYRNQILTNNAMAQQQIAGSTRYELDRQQRNAITRGATAAQRLVANINTQLGMQAKSAQQSLETSNVLAQQLLAQRQAQAGIRQDYMNQSNSLVLNKANTMSNMPERKNAYQQNKVDYAMDKNQYERDAWDKNVTNYFSGNDLAGGIYRRRHGNGVI